MHINTSTTAASRRRFLAQLAATGAFLTVPGAFAAALTPTARQGEGPFYPDHLPLDTDNDLLIVNDSITPATGEITYLSGRILGANGNPVRGATVEIWQCDVNGIYIHSKRSGGHDEQDKNFQGYGRFLTASSGEYRVKRGIRLQAQLPLATAPRDMLGEIGYYKYFTGHAWKRPAPSQRFFLEHKKAEMVDPEFAEKLCEHWLAAQDARSTQRLYAAIVEGMANATEWAYAECPDGYRSWWILGYRDTQTGEIAYSLYDQGLGITGTIRRKNSFLEILPGFRPSDPELIQQAVVDGRYSRTRQRGRGTGLPTLLEFVQEGTDGELLIFSKNSRCVFRHAQENLLNEYTIGLRGTLISWSFRP
jgi:hypothetical protein